MSEPPAEPATPKANGANDKEKATGKDTPKATGTPAKDAQT